MGNNREDDMVVDERNLLVMTTDIVSAYVGCNAVAVSDIPQLISTVYGSLKGLANPAPAAVESERKPAVPINKSIHDEYLINLIDGSKSKVLTRAIRRAGLTPDEYRKMFKLPHDYPMVAPAYSRKRADMAKEIGLGRRRVRTAA